MRAHLDTSVSGSNNRDERGVRPETIPSEILDYYAGGQEEHRLTASAGRLEWIRTWELLERFLPPPPARILDVGGGTGIYALPLAARGYRVHLIDAAANHVERARALSSASPHPLAGAEVGDARRLPVPDGGADAVLLFGPLYHLIERADRVAALREAHRALVHGGLLLAACISRFASVFAGIQEGVLRDPAFASIVNGDLENGIHRNPTSRRDWFTTAFLHRPEEIAAEIADGDLVFERLVPIEGPGWMARELDAWLDDATERERLLRVVRQLEIEPSLIGASAHLLAVARR
jgi:SAM-dependent methyltransferase